ncbi:MAG: hypothetical protein LIO57_05885 [Oscillospiraceae bacterium]|nr:hypothetical protein [Oscillospiraceae bacterium]
MQKTSVVMVVATLVASVFGAFLRWLQLMVDYDEETGFMARGVTPVTAVLVVYCVLVCVGAIIAASRLCRGKQEASSIETLMPGRSALVRAASVLCGVLFALASLVVLMTSNSGASPAVQRAFGAVGLAGGICIPVLFTPSLRGGAAQVGGIVIMLTGLVWLVYIYRLNSGNPVVWEYAFSMLSVSAFTLAASGVSGCFFGRGKVRQTLIWCLLGTFFCIVSLADGAGGAATLQTAMCALFCLLMVYLLVSAAERYVPTPEPEPPTESAES